MIYWVHCPVALPCSLLIYSFVPRSKNYTKEQVEVFALHSERHKLKQRLIYLFCLIIYSTRFYMEASDCLINYSQLMSWTIEHIVKYTVSGVIQVIWSVWVSQFPFICQHVTADELTGNVQWSWHVNSWQRVTVSAEKPARGGVHVTTPEGSTWWDVSLHSGKSVQLLQALPSAHRSTSLRVALDLLV